MDSQRLELKDLVYKTLEDAKAEDICVLDVSKHTALMDFMVVCTGRSGRHVAAVADRLIEAVKKAGFQPLGSEGQTAGEWVLVDLNSIIVHIMKAEIRQFYQIEKLWDISEKTD